MRRLHSSFERLSWKKIHADFANILSQEELVRTQKEQLQKRILDLKTKSKSWDVPAVRSQEEFRRLEEERDSLNYQEKEVDKELQRLNDEIQKFKHELDSRNSSKERVDSEKANIEERKSLTEFRMQSLQDKIESIQQKTHNIQNKIHDLTEEIHSFEQRHNTLVRQKLDPERAKTIEFENLLTYGEEKEVAKALFSELQADIPNQQLVVKGLDYLVQVVDRSPEKYKPLLDLLSRSGNRDALNEFRSLVINKTDPRKLMMTGQEFNSAKIASKKLRRLGLR